MLLSACANYKIDKSAQKSERKYYSSNGFALVYEDVFYEQKVVNKKLDNEQIIVMHSLLKKNTPIKIINPENSKVIETKVYKKANYPNIFNAIVSKKVALILELDLNNPYIEIIEIKKNKTFIAQKSNTFEEEKNVAEKAPVEEIKVDDLTNTENKNKKKIIKENNFILVINDFYYENSAINLRNELIKKANINNIFVKKINNNKYRLYVGPFKNFNTLKSTYISLNNLGFENLNVYKK